MTEKIKGQPLAIHKNYIIRGIEDAPDSSTTKELLKGLDCSTPEDAVKLLKEFPGDWIIRGQLLSHDSPELPEHLRKEDVLYAGHAEDIIQPAVRLGWQFVEDDYVDDGIIDWDHAIADATKFLKKKGHTVEYI